MSRRIPIFYAAMLLTGVNLLLRLVGTGFQVYLSRTIGAAGIGLLQLVTSVGMMASVAGMGGIRTAAMYLTAEELGKNHPGRVVWVLSGCMAYSICFSCTVAAGLYCFAPQIAGRWIGDPRTADALRLYAAFLPAVCLCGVMTGYFTAANRIEMLAGIEVAEQVCAIALTIGLLRFWGRNDPVCACLCVILGSSVSCCMTFLCLVILRCREHTPAEARVPVASRLARTALPLALGDDLKSGLSTFENLMVPKRLGRNPAISDPLSAFGLVSGMVFPVMMFPAAILFGLAELLIPELARCRAAGKQRRIEYLVGKGLHAAAIYGIITCGILYLSAQALCLRLYRSTDAARFLQLYACMVPFLYCDIITDAMTKGLGQQKVCVKYNILTSFLDVAFLFFLLPRFGMEGYYVSFAATHLLNFLLSLRHLRKISGCRISNRIPVLSGLSALFAIWASTHLDNPILRCGSYLILLGSMLFLEGIVSMADIRWARGLVMQK